MTSTKDYTMGILVPLGNKENSDDFCGELIKRIFILLGSNENSVGKKTYSCLEKVQEFRSSATLLGSYPRLRRNGS